MKILALFLIAYITNSVATSCTASYQCSQTSQGLGFCSGGQCVCNSPFHWDTPTAKCACNSPRTLTWISQGATCLGTNECFDVQQCSWPKQCTGSISFPNTPGTCQTVAPTPAVTPDPLGTAPCLIPGVETIFSFNESTAFWADDWGHFVHRIPQCVVFPDSAAQVSKVIKHAARYHLRVAYKGGEGHSTSGQTQVEGGIVIDTNNLDDMEINAAGGWARFGAGLEWDNVFPILAGQGLRPVMHVDTAELNLGGATSIGGLGALALHRGAFSDHILEIQVVTGTGAIITASKTSEPNLFNAVRGGLGQFGVIIWVKFEITGPSPLGAALGTWAANIGIVGATLPLPTGVTYPACNPVLPTFPGTPPPLEVIEYVFIWFSPDAFYDGVSVLANAANLDGFESFIVPNVPEQLSVLLPDYFASCFTGLPSAPPTIYVAIAVDMVPLIDTIPLLAVAQTGGLLFFSSPLPYAAYMMRQIDLVARFENLDVYWRPRLVYSAFVPLDATSKNLFLYAIDKIQTAGGHTSYSNWGGALSAFWTANFSTSYAFQIPRVPLVANFHFYIGQEQPESIVHESFWAQTDALQTSVINPLYAMTQAIYPGFKFYPQGARPYTWQQHFTGQQMTYSTVQSRKSTYDPNNVLGGGLSFT